MILSVEISYYPFQSEYIPPIQGVIEKLNSFNNLEVTTFPTATIVMGEYDHVFACLNTLMKWSYENFGRSIYVCKFITDYKAL